MLYVPDTTSEPEEMLVKVISTIGPVRRWADDAREGIASARAEIKTTLKHAGPAFTATEKDMKKLQIISADLVNKGNSLSRVPSTPPKELEKKLETLQKQYLALLQRDFHLSILDVILEDRSDLLQSLSSQITTFQIMKEIAVKSGIRGSGEENVEKIGFYAYQMLHPVKMTLDKADEVSYRKAACAWTQTHMPVGVLSSCAVLKKDSRTRLSIGKPERVQIGMMGLECAFWEELLGGKEGMYGSFSSDIRDSPSCLAKKGKA